MYSLFKRVLSKSALAMAVTALLMSASMAGQTPGQNGLMAFWYSPPEPNTSEQSLAVADPNGSYFEVILDSATTPDVIQVGHTSWSPDGSRIAFNVQDDNFDWDIS